MLDQDKTINSRVLVWEGVALYDVISPKLHRGCRGKGGVGLQESSLAKLAKMFSFVNVCAVNTDTEIPDLPFV